MKVLEKSNPCTVQWRPRSMFTVYSTVPLTHVLVNPTRSLCRVRHLSTFLFFPTSPGLSCPAFPSWDSPFPNGPNQSRGHPAALASGSHSSLVTAFTLTKGLPYHLASAHASSSVFYWECLLWVQAPPLPECPHVAMA